LQLNLGNASILLKRVYSVVNPYLSNQFEKENKGSIISEAYIRPDSLTGSNRIERVCQKGFEFNNLPGQNGMIFQLGQIDGIIPTDKLDKEHELLMVRICPKRSFPVVASEETLSEDYPIPEGFDSLCFKESEEDQEVYRHRFRINRKMQTLPYYIIQFTFTNIHEEKFKVAPLTLRYATLHSENDLPEVFGRGGDALLPDGEDLLLQEVRFRAPQRQDFDQARAEAAVREAHPQLRLLSQSQART
jgi:hypothetical protein